MNEIRILIVDTEESVRQGLRTILQLAEDLEVVGEAANGAQAIRLTEELRPQVIVVDMMMSTDDGLQAIKEIKRLYPESAVVLLSLHAGTMKGQQLYEHGIDAIVEKEAAIHTLVHTIRRMRHQTKERNK